MAERPILFSAPMVRAILEGRKTQTRRVLDVERMQNRRGTRDCDGWHPGDVEDPDWRRLAGEHWSPYGSHGDLIWVRETWQHENGSCDDHRCGQPTHIYYLATETYPESMRWRPSIFMPRWASRISLRVVSVRVERLQDISESDAQAEGIGSPVTRDCKRPKFEKLWDTINAKRAPWSSNPWVWVIEFERCACTGSASDLR